MTRAALLLSSLFVAACTVGDLPKNGNGGDDTTGIDAGSNLPIDGGATANGCINRAIAGDPHIHAAGGTTHAGESCVVSGCHLANAPGAGAPGFQFAGTVYKPGAGKIPSAGATIQVKSAAGLTTIGVTDTAGNFSILAGALQNAFPATVFVTACPTKTSMVSTLAQGGGNCTSAACHAGVAAGGTLAITLADQ